MLEASARAGGKIGTESVAGYLVEQGPHAVLDRGVLAPLGASVGATFVPASATARRRFVFAKGRRQAASPLALLSSLISPAGTLRLLAEPLVAAHRPTHDESLRDFCVRHFGAEAGALAARVFCSGVYAGDESLLSVRAAFPRMAALDAAHRSLFVGALANRGREGPAAFGTFEGGLGTLSRLLAAALGEQLVVGAKVDAIVARDHGWSVAWSGRRANEVKTDAIVLAVPSDAASALLANVAPAASETLAGWESSSVVLVHVGVRLDALVQPPRGFGVIGADDSLGALGVIFSSSFLAGRAPTGHALFTVMLGGARAPELVEAPEPELIATAREALRRCAGLVRAPVFTRVIRQRRAIPQYTLGHAGRLLAADRALESLPPIALAGASFHGVSVGDAARSGEMAAEKVAAIS